MQTRHSLRGATVFALVIGQPQQDIAPHQIGRIVRGEQVYVSEVQKGFRGRIEAHDIVADVCAAQQGQRVKTGRAKSPARANVKHRDGDVLEVLVKG